MENLNENPEQTSERKKRTIAKDEIQTIERTPGVGLDLGTMQLVSATMIDSKTSYKTQRDAFYDVENSIMSKNMLKNMKYAYIESADKKRLFVIGDAALHLASFFNDECRRPFSKGVISTREKEALSMIKTIMHGLVGDPIVENEKLYFSSPADPVDAQFNNIYHQNVLMSFLKSFGYDAVPINEAFAIVWAELEEEAYDGLALSFGAGQCNAALSLMGMSNTAQQFSIARSGDWLDEQSAISVGLKASRITMIKEAGVDLLAPKTREETAIKFYYENLITYVCNHLEKKFKDQEINFAKPITVVLSGGTSKAINFDKLFEQELRTKSLPFEIKNVKKASDPLNAVARGCLLNALMS